MKIDKIRAQTETPKSYDLTKPNFLCSRYKTFEFGIYPIEGLFSINVSCKFPIFTKNIK